MARGTRACRCNRPSYGASSLMRWLEACGARVTADEEKNGRSRHAARRSRLSRGRRGGCGMLKMHSPSRGRACPRPRAGRSFPFRLLVIISAHVLGFSRGLAAALGWRECVGDLGERQTKKKTALLRDATMIDLFYIR